MYPGVLKASLRAEGEAIQNGGVTRFQPGLLRRDAPRNDDLWTYCRKRGAWFPDRLALLDQSYGRAD
jgi:hypothetical protein